MSSNASCWDEPNETNCTRYCRGTGIRRACRRRSAWRSRHAPRSVAATLTIPKHPPMKRGTDVRPVRGYRVMRVPSTRELLFSRSSRRSRLRTSAARVGAPDSCGCTMGARLIAAGLVASTVWYVWHRHALGLSIWGVCVRVAAWSVLAGCVGKAIGLLRYRRLRTAQVRAGSVR